MGIKYKNNAITTITADIDDEVTTIPVSNAAVFPELGENDYCYLTIGEGTINMEIVKVTAIVGNDLTVVREQQGTVGRSFFSGAPIELRLTAGMLQAGFDEVADFASSEASSAASIAQSNAISSSNSYADTLVSDISELGDFSSLDEVTPTSGDLLVAQRGGAKIALDVDNIGGGKVIGEVYIFAGTTAPDDSLECTGATLDSVANPEYADLYTAIGTIWGGTGADDFDIPDLYTEGLFIRSRTATTTIGTVQSDTYLNHSHTGSTGNESAHTHGLTPQKGTSSDASNNNYAQPSVSSGTWGNYSWTTGAGSAHNHSVTVNTSTSGGTETRPKNASFMVCIKVI